MNELSDSQKISLFRQASEYLELLVFRGQSGFTSEDCPPALEQKIDHTFNKFLRSCSLYDITEEERSAVLLAVAHKIRDELC